MAMNLSGVRTFVTVADEGGVTRAAERLGVSQPAVSKALRQLEEELGVDLFHRDRRNGVTLTDAGERALVPARAMLQAEERLRQIAFLSQNLMEGTVRVATLPIGTERFLATALAEFAQACPNVDVLVEEATTEDVNRAVTTRAVDFGISLVPAEGLDAELLMPDWIVALSAEPLDVEAVDLTLPGGDYLACNAALSSIEPALRDAGAAGRSRFRMVGPRAVRAMAEAGLGTGLQAISHLEHASEHLHAYPVLPHVDVSVVLVANDLDDLTPAAAELADAVRRVAREMTAAKTKQGD